MIISKDNGKKLVELKENELIIYRFIKNKIIKRENIRSAYLNKDGLIVLTYDNKVDTISIRNMSWKDREGLKILVDEINNENIIFGTDYVDNTFWIMVMYPVLFIGQSNYTVLIIVLKGLIVIMLMVIAIIMSKNYRGNIYNIDTKEFEVIGLRRKVVRKFTISDIEFMKSNKAGTRYKIKDSFYKFYIRDVITYPILYKKAIDEMKIEVK